MDRLSNGAGNITPASEYLTPQSAQKAEHNGRNIEVPPASGRVADYPEPAKGGQLAGTLQDLQDLQDRDVKTLDSPGNPVLRFCDGEHHEHVAMTDEIQEKCQALDSRISEKYGRELQLSFANWVSATDADMPAGQRKRSFLVVSEHYGKQPPVSEAPASPETRKRQRTLDEAVSKALGRDVELQKAQWVIADREMPASASTQPLPEKAAGGWAEASQSGNQTINDRAYEQMRSVRERLGTQQQQAAKLLGQHGLSARQRQQQEQQIHQPEGWSTSRLATTPDLQDETSTLASGIADQQSSAAEVKMDLSPDASESCPLSEDSHSASLEASCPDTPSDLQDEINSLETETGDHPSSEVDTNAPSEDEPENLPPSSQVDSFEQDDRHLSEIRVNFVPGRPATVVSKDHRVLSSGTVAPEGKEQETTVSTMVGKWEDRMKST